MKNILIPLELSKAPIEERIIDIAISYAKSLGSNCWIVHVAAPDPDFVGYGVGPKYIRDQLAEDLRTEHRQLQSITDRFKAEGIKAEGLLIQGATQEMIKVEVKKLNIDLLVLGNKKHSFVNVLFKGSILDDIMDEVNIPVLLVPDHE